MDKDAITIKLEGVSFRMIRVEGGTFTMGLQDEDPNGENYYEYTLRDEKEDGSMKMPTPHKVTLDTYYIGDTVVTQSLWKSVMGENGRWKIKDDDLPVTNVSWNDCASFIRRLNAQTNMKFRLPTEAEWEFAARGGKKARGYQYSGSNELNKVGWSDHSRTRRLHPVKQKRHNELGIYDMSGNVWEWCNDWFDSYPDGPQTNPQGPGKGQWNGRVVRGGSWRNNPVECHVGSRGSMRHDAREETVGFRLAMSCV